MPAKTEYYCADCGKQLSEDERPCSNCGSTRRKINLEVKEKIGLKLKEIEYNPG